VCQALIEWWAEDAPSLAYDVDDGPSSLSGWLPGDILQYLRDSRPDGGGGANAQTPWWVADFIISRTLLPAAADFPGELLRTVDPACGTGHYLVRLIDHLWEWYTTGTLTPRQGVGGGINGGPIFEPREAIRRIIAGVDGCEIDPLTAAVARLRMVVVVGELMHRSGLIPALRLDAIPPYRPRILVGDSLLAGKVGKAEYARLHPHLAEIENLGYDEKPDDPRPGPAAAAPVITLARTEQLDLFAEAAS
jgi:hypothetical protein